MRGADHSYSGVQLIAWKDIEGRLHHRYFPANFLKLLTTPPYSLNNWDKVPVKLTSPLRSNTSHIQILIFCLTHFSPRSHFYTS